MIISYTDTFVQAKGISAFRPPRNLREWAEGSTINPSTINHRLKRRMRMREWMGNGQWTRAALVTGRRGRRGRRDPPIWTCILLPMAPQPLPDFQTSRLAGFQTTSSGLFTLFTYFTYFTYFTFLPRYLPTSLPPDLPTSLPFFTSWCSLVSPGLVSPGVPVSLCSTAFFFGFGL